jgi:hypothetical protein
MINRNRPSVTIVMGSVRIIRSGLTIAFKKASTSAKMIAVVNEFITTWGSKSLDKTYTTTAVISKLINHLIIYNF